MTKKHYVVLLLFIISCLHSFIRCQGGFALGNELLTLMQKQGTTKKQVLDKIHNIDKEKLQVKNILKFGKIIKQTHYYLMEYIFLKLPSDLEELRKSNPQEKLLSLDDVLEISKSLWKLAPAQASSLKAYYNKEKVGKSDSEDLRAQPLIHSLIDAYFAEKEPKKKEFFEKFIDFIVKEHPETLSVTDNCNRTVLHNLLIYTGGGGIEEPELVNTFLKKFLDANVNVCIKDRSGKTALEQAHSRGAQSSVALLFANSSTKKEKSAPKNPLQPQISPVHVTTPPSSINPESNTQASQTGDVKLTPNTSSNQSATWNPWAVGGTIVIATLLAGGMALLIERLSQHRKENQHEQWHVESN